MKKLVISVFVAAFLIIPNLSFAEQPRFTGELTEPPSLIAPYPAIEKKPVISLYSGLAFQGLYLHPSMRRITRVERSNFNNQTITFGGNYYTRGLYQYGYTPRAANAESYSAFRIEESLDAKLGQLRATALTKRQQDKAGGLLNLNIPIKSKSFEQIFGEGGAGLKVSGYHRISFSGRSTWTDQASTATIKQSKFPSLNMEQVSRFTIDGTIGSKITVSVTQDSNTDIPLANRLILRYKGDEDDILQTVEAGNTNLSLPNTRFVGYSQNIQGLFGIKTTAQIGGLSLTAIASQEKGNSERKSIEAGASATMNHIRDYEYAYGRIYDLGRMATNYDVPADFDFADGDSILEIEVYKSSRTGTGTSSEQLAAPDARFFVDPSDTTSDSLETTGTQVILVEGDQYYVHPTEFWILFETTNAGTNYELGYYMRVRRANGVIDTIGTISEEPYRLKLLRHGSPSPTYVTWNYEWRNVYYLRGTDIDVSGLEINIFKGTTGTEGQNENLDNQNGIQYIQILGLDRFDKNGAQNPDNLVDVESTIIDRARGLLIFPDRKPFNPSTHFVESVELDPKVPEIYEKAYADQDVIKQSTYYIQVSNLSRTAEVSLNQANIIENSERISVNGRELVKGKDYNINYDFGKVTFLTDEALDANANITIDFEYTPFITIQKKSLFGIRGEYEFSKDLKVGSTFLYKSDKATDRKPKVGEETSRSYIWDADVSFKLKPNLFTKMINALPLYSTEAASNLQISAEVAKSYPNPNVDGDAYIDDFEGSRDSYSLGIFRESWTKASIPEDLPLDYYRSRMIWYNPYTQIATNRIWDRDEGQQTGTHTLWIGFSPHDSLIYKTDSETGDTIETITPKSWAGIMRSLSAGAANQDNAQLLELRVYGTRGIIHAEFGEITEDINRDGIINTEDIKDPISGIPNLIIDPGEDVGLDGLADNQEPGYNDVTNPDPDGDDWWYNGSGIRCSDCTDDPNDYRFINGTEGNEQDPNRFGRPDTEDIDNDNFLDILNNYYSYKIDLSDDRFLASPEDYNGWRTFRVQLRDPDALDTVVNSPDWTKISYIRLWFESPDELPVTIGIAAADLIQSNWEDTLVYLPENEVSLPISKFSVAVINNQENPEYKADPPPGVSGYYDKQNDIVEPEQSLLLHYENLNPGDTCIARRYLYDTPNYAGYRKLSMLVHGPTEVDSVLFFFRLGDSEDDYYEFRSLLKPGWDPDNTVDIDFNSITALKDTLLMAKADNPDTNEIINAGNYRIWGEPTITRIKYLACGIVNISQKNASYFSPTGDVWVNELKLTDVRRDAGSAARVAVSGNMADLFSYRFNYEYTDAYFRNLATSSSSTSNLGSGRTSTSISGGVSFDLNKFIPKSFDAKMPVSISYSKRTLVPLLRTNSDIILPRESQDKESTITESKGLSVSESFNKKTKNPLFTLLLNPFKSNFSYNRTEGRSPQVPSSFSETYYIKASYGFNFGRVPGIKPFFWTKPVPLLKRLSTTTFYFLPNGINTSGDLNRNLSISENSSGVVNQTLKRTFSGNARVDYKMSNNLTTNFRMSTQRDMEDPDKVKITLNPKTFRLGRETSYSQSFGATYQLALFSFLTHSFTYSVDYREARNVRDSTRNVTSTKSYGVNGNFDHIRLFTRKSSKIKSDAEDRKRRRARRRPPKDAAAADSLKTDNEKDPGKEDEIKQGKSLGDIFFTPLSKTLLFLTGWLNPIGYDFSEKYSYSYTGLAERASTEFRFGLTDGVGVPIRATSSGSTYSTAVSKLTSYSFRTGTQFFGGLKTDVSFSKRISRDIKKSSNPSKSISTVFPDIKFTIRPLKTVTFLNNIISRFNPRTGYTRSTDKTYNLQTGNQTSERKSTSQRPLLNMTATVLNGVQLTFGKDRSVTEDKTLNSQTGQTSSRRKTTTTSTTFSVKYTFNSPRGIKIPIFGRLRFRSNLSFSTDISLQKQLQESAANDGGYSITGEESNLTISPTVSYSFSTQINGGLTGRWQTNNNVAQSRKSNTRELRIWVDIRF